MSARWAGVRFEQTATDGMTVSGLPVAGVITSGFGARDIAEHAAGHTGVDIAAEEGTAVRAPADGMVCDVFSLAIEGEVWAQGWKRVLGNSVIIGHGEFVTLYAHLAQPPSVFEGQRVRAGDLLGYVGATGLATGSHLHWGMAPVANRYVRREGPGGLLDPLAFAGGHVASERPVRVDLDALRAKLEEALAMLR